MSPEETDTCADELTAWLRLSLTDGIGAARARALLQSLGPPEAVLEAGPGRVADVLRSRALALALFQEDTRRDALISRALLWLNTGPHRENAWDGPSPMRRTILVLTDPRYPPRLLDLTDPPLVLYCVGDPAWLIRPQIGIVGSRNATALGARTARELAAALAAAGWTITSGMAEGIDQAAHEGALGTAHDDGRGGVPGPAAGSTVAALGTGIDRIYPSRHRSLAGRIAAQGALLSEQPIGTAPLPANFPRRNRLIAALASGVLVVEANLRSGSLITARLAAELGREVMAVPGSVHSPLARGTNSLIRQGAKLVETAGDILVEVPEICQLRLRFASGHRSSSPEAVVETTPSRVEPAEPDAIKKRGQPEKRDEPDKRDEPETQDLPEMQPLSAEQAAMLAAMSADPVRLEILAARQRLSVGQALAALQTLELSGLVERQLDGSYVRCP